MKKTSDIDISAYIYTHVNTTAHTLSTYIAFHGGKGKGLWPNKFEKQWFKQSLINVSSPGVLQPFSC